MKKVSKHITILIITIFSVVGLFSPFSSSVNAKEGIALNNVNEEESMMETAEQLSTYFELDQNGNIIFNVDQNTLVKELGISQEDAALMIGASEELSRENVGSQIQARGFVGIYLNLGPKVRKMNGWAAGAFAGGYVGWYAKNFAVNPVTAGVAALITGATTLTVKNAVERGIRRVSLGRNIGGYSWSFNVNIP